MSDYKKVLKNISHLESMLPGVFGFTKPDWKEVWNQIRLTGKSFKGTQFPTKEEHEAAWSKFQELVDKTKEHQRKFQEENQKQWAKKRDLSASLRNQIVSLAQSAHPYNTGFADIVLTLVTGGVYLVLKELMGPFDEERDMLKSCSDKLRSGWALLKENKEKMLGKDKSIAFEELSRAKELLDRRWDIYKRERQKAYDQYQQQRQQKQNDWRRKMENSIRQLEERQLRLSQVLAHKERHLGELQNKLYSARSDDFRYRVSGWISEEEDSISEIRQKLSKIEGWIYENREKLRS